MKKREQFTNKRTRSLLMLFTAAAFNICGSAAFAQTSQDVELKLCENIVLGGEQTGRSQERRISDLEVTLFGASQSGDCQSRLASIVAYLRAHINRPLQSLPGAGAENLLPIDGSNSLQTLVPQLAQADTSGYMAEASRAYADGDFDRAIGAYYKVLELSPGNVVVHYNLGVIHQQRAGCFYSSGQFEKAAWFSRRARECFAAGLYYCPDDPACRKGIELSNRLIKVADRAQNAVALRNWQERQEHFKQEQARRIALDAGNDFKTHHYEQAISKLTLLIQKYGREKDAGVQYGLACSYKAIGKLDQALRHASIAVANASDDNTYLKLLSQITEDCKHQRGIR